MQQVSDFKEEADVLTALRIEGPIASHWMAIAQCFAGPRETAPANGARFRVTG